MKEAVFSGSRAVYRDMEYAAKSLAANSSVERIHFLIEDDEFPRELPDLVEVRNVSGQGYFRKDGPNMRSGYTYLAMMRAALCYEFPDSDAILSLDCDAFCVGDVDSVWDLPIRGGYYFAASIENHRTHDGFQYANTGVALYNLALLRDSGKADEVIEVLNTRRFTWLEQDVFNYLCQGHIYEMPRMFNSNEWTGECHDPKIVHFAGIPAKTYRTREIYRKYADLTWEDALERRS